MLYIRIPWGSLYWWIDKLAASAIAAIAKWLFACEPTLYYRGRAANACVNRNSFYGTI